MQCSKETIVRLFYNASSSFQLLFLFFYLTSIFLSKFLFFISAIPFLPRNDEEYEYSTVTDEEEEEEEEVEVEVEDDDEGFYYDEGPEKDHLVADIIEDGENLLFLQTSATSSCQNSVIFDEEIVNDPLERAAVSDDSPFYSAPESDSEEHNNQEDRPEEEDDEDDDEDRDTISLTAGSKSASTSFRYDMNTPAITTRAKSACTSFRYVGDEPSLRVTKKIAFVLDDDKIEGIVCVMCMFFAFYFIEKYRETGKKLESNLTQVDKFLNLASLNPVTKRFELEEKDKEEIFGDTNTVGSTSKSSSEWRSSINCRDPSYDPFSSSSRRSCPKWESYTVFQKYDEEMLFLDRISAQKLQETESFRSSMTCHSSISEKIIHKLASRNRKTSYIYQNSYHELEAAYVAQICLTWEALNWNYKYFHQLRVSRRDSDLGCPAYVAQQFQQFQVLLQRYIENEPYENGRRPVVYARMRSLAPKLLQVPEYRDSDDEKKDEYLGSRISSDSFLVIMEEAIKTFMNFLRVDKENHFHIFTDLFRIKNPRTSVDPTLLQISQEEVYKLGFRDIQKTRITESNERKNDTL
ncbi:Protein of unknown function DUF1666 [Cynara cardunculus var. scolymus]|uniref:Ribosomal protein L34Ae n=1 Tax=Cynara cardunculus var. scolymus TaxID=59895 RepID=A0A118K2J4_CYNCS|nr:Protein of unknown function DUF1666 [Cynara cardunculus var. scolymus]